MPRFAAAPSRMRLSGTADALGGSICFVTAEFCKSEEHYQSERACDYADLAAGAGKLTGAYKQFADAVFMML